MGRFRCKVILGLAQGKTPSQLVSVGMFAGSRVYLTAHLFSDEGLRGMADKREDNGEQKVNARYASQLLTIVAGSPQEHGYLRTTWTREPLILVLAERTSITISVSTMSRLLKRHGVHVGRQADRGVSLGEGPTGSQVAANQATRPGRRTGRGRALGRRGEHTSKFQDRAGLDAAGPTEKGPHPWPERETLPGQGVGRAQGQVTWVEGPLG